MTKNHKARISTKGLVIDTDGAAKLIVWVKMESREPNICESLHNDVSLIFEIVGFVIIKAFGSDDEYRPAWMSSIKIGRRAN